MAQVTDSLISTLRSTPKDAQVMAAILKEMGVDDYEPRVLNQMLEFTYRYVSNIIEDAQLYSNHAKKKSAIDIDDVTLAIHLQQERNTNAPDREITVEMAKLRNSMSLPLIKSSAGLRLPPDRFSLTACNYRLKSSSKKGRTVHTVSRLNSPNPVSKNSPLTLLNKQTIMARPGVSKPVTTPIVKFSEENRVITSASSLSSLPLTVTSSIAPATSGTHIVMSSSEAMNSELKLPSEMITSVKRKHENDDDYDMDVV